MATEYSGSRSRRRHPRLEVLNRVEGRLVPSDLAIVVRDISLGGFSAESPVAFPPRTRHHFRFTSRSGPVVQLEASSIHCRLVAANELGQRYITGFEFVTDEHADEALTLLLESLAEASHRSDT
jgi:hypothetical protein